MARTKQILSANTEAPISVEELWQDRDFRSTISRDKFEELAGAALMGRTGQGRAHLSRQQGPFAAEWPEVRWCRLYILHSECVLV